MALIQEPRSVKLGIHLRRYLNRLGCLFPTPKLHLAKYHQLNPKG
jgi:hypothetical protein